MALSLTNETKNTISITNEDKPSAYTWGDADIALEDATTSWAEGGGLTIAKESKNNLTITNESKS